MEKTMEEFERKGYKVIKFQTGKEAVEYLKSSITGKTVGFGGSQTLTQLDLRHVLAEENQVYVPDFPSEGETFDSTARKASNTDIFLLSANAVSKEGDIINIDGIGNRLAASLFGPGKVIYVIGKNKIGGTLEEAISRARNIASPKNALRFRHKTPCAMAVIKCLEKEFREKYHVTGEIDQLEWQRFIEKLDESELNTHCYNCKSPSRICGSLLVHMRKPDGVETEVIIIDEDFGF